MNTTTISSDAPSTNNREGKIFHWNVADVTAEMLDPSDYPDEGLSEGFAQFSPEQGILKVGDKVYQTTECEPEAEHIWVITEDSDVLDRIAVDQCLSFIEKSCGTDQFTLEVVTDLLRLRRAS